MNISSYIDTDIIMTDEKARCLYIIIMKINKNNLIKRKDVYFMEYVIKECNDNNCKKKLISLLFRTLSLLLIIVLAFFAFHFVYGYTDTNLQNNSIVGTKLIGTRIYGDNSVTQEHLEIVNNFFDNLQPEIKEKYIEQNWLMIIASSAPTTLLTKTVSFSSSNYDHHVYSNLGGLTIPRGKIIYLNTSVNSLDNFKENLAHEFGHCIDYFAGYPSYTNENIVIYQKYSVNKDWFNDYEQSNTTEFFASAYKEYILNKDIIKNEAPEIYEFMKENENTICNTSSLFINTPGFFRQIIYSIKGMSGNI